MSGYDTFTTCFCFFWASVAAMVWFTYQDPRASSYELCVEGISVQAERVECAKAVYAEPDQPSPGDPSLVAILAEKKALYLLCAPDLRSTTENQRTACYDRVYGNGFDAKLDRWLVPSSETEVAPAPKT
jgi:hypothetical protein